MVLRRFTLGLALAVALLAAPLAAQTGSGRPAASPRDLSFNLKGKQPGVPLPPGLGEFNIQLDSRLPGTAVPTTSSPSPVKNDVVWACGGDSALTPVFTDRKLELRRTGALDSTPAGRPLGEIHRSSFSLGSTLTLSSGYAVDRADWGGPVAPSVAAEGRVGRFTVRGEMAKERGTALLYQSPRPARTTTLDPALPKASVRLDQPRLDTTAPGPERAAAEARPLTIENYSLEAAYNFSPRFEGKLSYRRSMTDVRDSADNVQVEGSVKTGQNVTIKAGYHNETRPEATKGQPVNDQKIWTEFLLKF